MFFFRTFPSNHQSESTIRRIPGNIVLPNQSDVLVSIRVQHILYDGDICVNLEVVAGLHIGNKSNFCTIKFEALVIFGVEDL